MDKYAHRLHDWLESSGPGFEVRLAAYIGDLTREARDGRRSGAHPKWWAREVDPARIVLPGPLVGPQRYAARYFFYPWRLKLEARRAALVHILDHTYAHMLPSVRRHPVVVTVHDLMPVIVLRSPTDGWREGPRGGGRPGGCVRGGARGRAGGAETGPASAPGRGGAARRGGGGWVGGGGGLDGRPAAPGRGAGPAALCAQRPVRGGGHAAPRL